MGVDWIPQAAWKALNPIDWALGGLCVLSAVSAWFDRLEVRAA